MTSLLARLGQHFDSRRAAQTVWTTGKRKRGGEWMCADCKARKALRQRRGYSHDSIRPASELYRFSLAENDGDDTTSRRYWKFREEAAPDCRSPLVGKYNTTGHNASFKQNQLNQNELARLSEISEGQEQTELLEQFEAAEDNADISRAAERPETNTRDIVEDALPSIAQDTMLHLDYKQELSTALLRGEADLVIRCLYAANLADDLDFLRSIPPTKFSEIIRLLEPKNFVSRLGSAHIELSNAKVAQMGIASMRQVAFEYASVLRHVLAIRRSVGVNLTLADYTVLLRSARDLGNQKMGFSLWNHLHNDGHVPNTSCYNYYMATVVWNGMHLAGSRHKVRVIPFNMLARRKTPAATRFHNYRVGPGGVRETAMKIFNDMLSHGAMADEESFRMLITASAREGDINMVKSLLKKIWNIDVEAILEGKDETTIAPKPLPEHSPLRPTSALLFSIAHAFGVNNDIPAALRTVDFVARHYNLSITNEVWNQLFEWTFVLTVNRYGKNRTDGSMTGQLPAETLLSLWNTMTGEPYFVRPTMGMYNHLIRNLCDRGATANMIETMREGIRLYDECRYQAYKAKRYLDKNLRLRDAGLPHESIETQRHNWEYADLIRQRDHFWVKRWLRLLLSSCRKWIRSDHSQQLLIRELPRLLWEWRVFAPSDVRYEMRTGFVQFAIRSDEDMLQNAESLAKKHEEKRQMIVGAFKYVGNRWVRGRELPPPKRLLNAKQAAEADSAKMGRVVSGQGDVPF